MSGASGDWGYEQDQIVSLPYFRLGSMGIAMGGVGGVGTGATGIPVTDVGAIHPRVITTERVPAGEVEVRRSEHVHATDDHAR